MPRLVCSLVTLLAAIAVAGPSRAADWDVGGGDAWGGDDLRGAYVNEPKDWVGWGDEDDPMRFEFGLRYWYSWGAQNFSSAGADVGATDNSHIGEAHMRIEDHSSNVYVKALGGLAFKTDGSFTSPLGGAAVADGQIGYLGADIGWNLVGSEGSGFGALVGYQFWRDAPDTGRFNFTTASAGNVAFDPVSGQTFLPGDSAPNSLDAHLLRLGVQGKANFNNFIDITAELAAVPYAKVSGSAGVEDVSFNSAVYNGPAQMPYGAFNGNISSMRSSPTTLDGWGYGAQAELWLGVHPIENMTFRVGGRAWYIQGTADATFSATSVGNPGQSGGPGTAYDIDPAVNTANFISTNNPFSMLRYGLLAELTYSF